MDTLDRLKTENFWVEFLDYKTQGEHLSAYEETDLRAFIENREYFPIIARIEENKKFPMPKLTELNKKNSNKKRKVFVYDREENYFLKAVAYLLSEYDYIFPKNLYSFRRNVSVKRAIFDLVKQPNLSAMYSYKVDIHDYFNSISVPVVLGQLKKVLLGEDRLFRFIEELLTEPLVLCGDKTITCTKGIMAGVPISGFLANLHLKALDEWFAERGLLYARYSDDIIVFAESAELIAVCETKIKDFLKENNLTVNERKEYRTRPQEAWEFLGFRIEAGKIDLAPISLEKMKDKMRRKARALVRWKKRNGASNERAIAAFIRHFNRKFYDNPRQHEVTWCRWYFPTITTAKSLRVLDEYMIACVRYIATGKHTKANFNLRYERIKELGFKSLVNAYYAYRKTFILTD